MPSTRPSIVLRIRKPNGQWTYARPVFASNNRPKPLYAVVDGSPEHHPEGIYYVRSTVYGRRQLKRAGQDPAEAKALQTRQHLLLQGLALGVESPELLTLGPKRPADDNRIRWDEAVRTYIAEVCARRSPKTATAYRHALIQFETACHVDYLDEITRDSVLRYEAWIRREGNSARTAYNRISQIGTFLRYWKMPDVIARRDLPRFTKKLPIAYSIASLRQLLMAAPAEDRLLFEFFLGSGCREQEVMYMTEQDIDFEGQVIHVRAKPEWKWKPKDNEERAIPISEELLGKLKLHIGEFQPNQRLLFPSTAHPNKPDGHFLRRIKGLAQRAGLNCGQPDKHLPGP